MLRTAAAVDDRAVPTVALVTPACYDSRRERLLMNLFGRRVQTVGEMLVCKSSTCRSTSHRTLHPLPSLRQAGGMTASVAVVHTPTGPDPSTSFLDPSI